MAKMTHAVARREDPWTSWAAAHSISDVTSRQAAVVHLFRTCGPMTLETACDRYRGHQADRSHDLPDTYPPQTDSSIRSRAAEMVARGFLEDTGETVPTKYGRQARLLRWRAPSPRDPAPRLF